MFAMFRVTVAIVIAWVCFVYEFLSSLSGILMYNHYNNAWSKQFFVFFLDCRLQVLFYLSNLIGFACFSGVFWHAIGILLLVWYLSAYWPCTAIWPIIVFGDLVPAIFDFLAILFTRIILRSGYLPPRI